MAKRLNTSYIQIPKKAGGQSIGLMKTPKRAGGQSIRLVGDTPKAPTSTVFPRKTAGGIILNPKVGNRFPILKKRAK